MTHEVLTSIDGRAGRLRLNRPKAIHALTREMCSAMLAALQAWRTNAEVRAVMIDHAEGRGFCAGGDVVTIARSGATDGEECTAYADCVALLDEGKEIRYTGPSGIGPINEKNDPSSAFVGIYKFNAENKNEIASTVEGSS